MKLSSDKLLLIIAEIIAPQIIHKSLGIGKCVIITLQIVCNIIVNVNSKLSLSTEIINLSVSVDISLPYLIYFDPINTINTHPALLIGGFLLAYV